MKRLNNLYEKIISLDNLRLADEKARKGKKKNIGVILHDKHREEDLLLLHEQLKNHTFVCSEYTTFTIYEPKERLISRLPYFPDRVLHHAILNVLEPIWVPIFTHNTYSCIKGRGIDGCAKQVEKIIRKYAGRPLYCLKIDIRKYYPSIDHDVMKRIVRRKIKDAELLWLLDLIIDSTDGLPIGNYTSQYLANLFLAYFMHWVNEKLPAIITGLLHVARVSLDATEYADDIVFFSDDKAVLRAALPLIQRYLEDELHLQLKPNWQIFPVAVNRADKTGRALDYVGYKFFREQKLLRKSVKQNFCRAAAKANRNKKLDVKAYKQELCAWFGWAKHSNSRHLTKKIIKPQFYEACKL